MANVPGLASPSLQPALIQVGPGLLYTNVTKPIDGATLLVSGMGSGAMDQRVYGPLPFTISGTFLGSTIGTSNVSYRPNFVPIKIEQALATVEMVINQEEARCTFNVAEITAERLRETLPSNYFSPIATLKTVDADPLQPNQYRHTITLGGIRLVEPQCIAFVSANRRISVPGNTYSYVYCGYNSVSTEGFDMPFSRGDVTTWRCTYEQLADITRTIGDQMFQFTARSNVSS